MQGDTNGLRWDFEKAGIPLVQLSGLVEPDPSQVTVLPDNRAIGRLAAAHFLERGFREFAFFGVATHWYSRERLAGFREGIKGHSCQIMEEDSPEEAGYARWLQSLPQGTALFCANDIFARRAVRLLRETGRSVPEDVAVVGADNDETVLALSEVPLSSVDPRSAAIGAEAARVLALMMDGQPAPPLTLVAPAGVVTRQSSDILLIPDPKVAAAVALIRERACEGLAVDDLVRRSGLSRRMLERRFIEALGRGIGAELRRVRIQRAIELLDNTDLPVGEIAFKAGFTDIYYFSAAFRKATGRSPSAWRAGKLTRPGA